MTGEMLSYDELAEKNKRYLWHPFTQMKEYIEDDPVIIASGNGRKLRDVRATNIGMVYLPFGSMYMATAYRS